MPVLVPRKRKEGGEEQKAAGKPKGKRKDKRKDSFLVRQLGDFNEKGNEEKRSDSDEIPSSSQRATRSRSRNRNRKAPASPSPSKKKKARKEVTPPAKSGNKQAASPPGGLQDKSGEETRGPTVQDQEQEQEPTPGSTKSNKDETVDEELAPGSASSKSKDETAEAATEEAPATKEACTKEDHEPEDGKAHGDDAASLSSGSEEKGEPEEGVTVTTEEEKQRDLKLSRCILFKSLAGEPIERKAVCMEVGINPNDEEAVKDALISAGKRLRDVFGYKLLPLPQWMVVQESVEETYSERLCVVPDGKLDDDAGTHSKEMQSVHMEVAVENGLLMMVLAFIYCEGERRVDGSQWIQESDLYELLNKVDEHVQKEPPVPGKNEKRFPEGTAEVLGEEKPHPPTSQEVDAMESAGAVEEGTPNVDAKLEHFVKNDYLLKEPQGEHAFLYALGPRAAVEIGLRQLISFCAEVLGEGQPHPTTPQEVDAMESAGAVEVPPSIPAYDANKLARKFKRKLTQKDTKKFNWGGLGVEAGVCFNSLPSKVLFLKGPLSTKPFGVSEWPRCDKRNSLLRRLDRLENIAENKLTPKSKQHQFSDLAWIKKYNGVDATRPRPNNTNTTTANGDPHQESSNEQPRQQPSSSSSGATSENVKGLLDGYGSNSDDEEEEEEAATRTNGTQNAGTNGSRSNDKAGDEQMPLPDDDNDEDESKKEESDEEDGGANPNDDPDWEAAGERTYATHKDAIEATREMISNGIDENGLAPLSVRKAKWYKEMRTQSQEGELAGLSCNGEEDLKTLSQGRLKHLFEGQKKLEDRVQNGEIEEEHYAFMISKDAQMIFVPGGLVMVRQNPDHPRLWDGFVVSDLRKTSRGEYQYKTFLLQFDGSVLEQHIHPPTYKLLCDAETKDVFSEYNGMWRRLFWFHWKCEIACLEIRKVRPRPCPFGGIQLRPGGKSGGVTINVDSDYFNRKDTRTEDGQTFPDGVKMTALMKLRAERFLTKSKYLPCGSRPAGVEGSAASPTMKEQCQEQADGSTAAEAVGLYIKNEFQQTEKGDRKCVGSSFAFAMQAVPDWRDRAAELKGSLDSIPDIAIDQLRTNCIQRVLNVDLPRIKSSVTDDHFNPFDRKHKHFFAKKPVLVLLESLGHALAFYRRWIFDGAEEYPLLITTPNIRKCLGQGGSNYKPGDFLGRAYYVQDREHVHREVAFAQAATSPTMEEQCHEQIDGDIKNEFQQTERGDRKCVGSSLAFAMLAVPEWRDQAVELKSSLDNIPDTAIDQLRINCIQRVLNVNLPRIRYSGAKDHFNPFDCKHKHFFAKKPVLVLLENLGHALAFFGRWIFNGAEKYPLLITIPNIRKCLGQGGSNYNPGDFLGRAHCVIDKEQVYRQVAPTRAQPKKAPRMDLEALQPQEGPGPSIEDEQQAQSQAQHADQPLTLREQEKLNKKRRKIERRNFNKRQRREQQRNQSEAGGSSQNGS